MKKQQKKPRRARKEVNIEALDWTPLFKAFREAFEWALDVAAALARDYPEEVEAVERVRAFMRARLAGQEASVVVDDVLFTFGLLLGAIERDLGPIGLSGAWYPPPLTFHFPSAPATTPKVPRVFMAHPWLRPDSTRHAFA